MKGVRYSVRYWGYRNRETDSDLKLLTVKWVEKYCRVEQVPLKY